MKPAPFDYFAPTTVDEVRDLLKRYGDDAKILAGGQSLVPVMVLRLSQPSVVIDVNRVGELDYIRDDAHGLAIGAVTRHRTVERSPLVRKKAPLLATAVEWIGHPQIRNRGTIGGSLAHADPAAELPALAAALDATFTVTNASGAKRTLKASDFFVSYLTTALDADDLLSEIYFPALPAGAGWSFQEVARRHGDFALVGVVAVVGLDDAGPQHSYTTWFQRRCRSRQSRSITWRRRRSARSTSVVWAKAGRFAHLRRSSTRSRMRSVSRLHSSR